MRASKAKRLRSLLEAVADFLTDEEALEAVELVRQWDCSAAYQMGQRVRENGVLYRCLQDHQAQTGWNPADTPSLWARVLIEDPGTVPGWVQPESTNGYMVGNRVIHNGRVWVSTIDHNTWEPGILGWEEMI